MRPRHSVQGIAIFVLAVGLVLAGLGSAAEAAPCPNEVFRIGFGAHLPDCRAYEQVSPVEKLGAQAAGVPDHVIAAEKGPGIAYFSANGTAIPSAGEGATGDYPTLLATRAGESWTTKSLLAPQRLGVRSQFLGLTPDLRYDVVQAVNTERGTPGYGNGLYLIDTATDEITTIVPNSKNSEQYEFAFAGSSADDSKFFFETGALLTPEAQGIFDNLYVWDRATGAISLVGILPEAEGGEEPIFGTFGGAYLWFEGEELFQGGALGGNAVSAIHAISPDGNQAYFTAAESGQLYLRRGLNGPTPTTVNLSEPNTDISDPNAPKPAAFQEATIDGSRAFFLSSAKLAAGANTGPTDEGKDLYRFEANSPPGQRLTDLTPDSNGGTPNGAEVRGLLGISESGDAGYFVARGVLANGAVAGDENLYRFEDAGSGITLKFIATLRGGQQSNRPKDEYNWSPRTYEQKPGIATLKNRTARVSADGNVLVFASQEDLTGYDPVGEGCGNANTVFGEQGSYDPRYERCSEIFRYDAISGELTCLSCSPNGEAPLGAATFGSPYLFSKPVQVPEVQSAVTFPNNVSKDGNRVFFQTAQPLVSGDNNGSGRCELLFYALEGPEFNCQDVYEWEAPGTPGGSCERAEVNGGCLYLLSSGQSDEPSFFAGASADGSNAYILTTSQLVPADTDVAVDIYNAQAQGGLASQQSGKDESCVAEGCLGLPAPPPATPTTGTSHTEGPGNQKSHKPKKHKKHKKHKHRKGKHRKSSGKKHSGTAKNALRISWPSAIGSEAHRSPRHGGKGK